MIGRCISSDSIRKAVAVVVMFLTICLTSTLLLMLVSPQANSLDVIYETFSATATVGLSRSFTASLNGWGKLIIIVTMYFGRVGVLTISLGFLMGDRAEERFRYAYTDLLIG